MNTTTKTPSAEPKSATRPPSTSSLFAPGQMAAIGLPMRFMLTGLVSLFVAVVVIWFRPDILATYHYNQYVIAVTHLVVLGFISSIVMGALYQLVPVALETPLYSVRLARWQFVFHFVGVSGMVWMFWKWDMKQVGHFGMVYSAGVGLFVYNIARTLWRAPHRNVIAWSVAASLGWLSLAILAGLAIAAGKCSYDLAETLAPTSFMGALVNVLKQIGYAATRFDQIGAMHAHAHLGAVGVFLMLIVGISYKLMPMFTLSEVQNQRRAMLSVILLNAGLAAVFVTILLRSPWRLGAAGLVISGLVLYGFEMRAILAARKRATLDWGLKYFLTAICLLAPVAVLAAILSAPGLPLTAFTGQLENLYGFLGMLGVIALAIIGMLYKILPFLVWYLTYSPLIGQRKVPSLADLYSSRIQLAGYWTYVSGLLITSIGIGASSGGWVKAGISVMILSLILLVWNVGLILRHWLWRKPKSSTGPQRAPAPERTYTRGVPALR